MVILAGLRARWIDDLNFVLPIVVSSWLAASPPVPLHLIENPVAPSRVSLSPEGQAAWLAGGAQGFALFVGSAAEIGDNSEPRLTLGPVQVHSLSWFGERWLLHTSDVDQHVLWSDSGLGPKPVLALERVNSVRVLGRDSQGRPLLAHDARRPHAPDVFRLDLEQGKAALVEHNPGRVFGWMLDAAGEIRAARRWRPAGYSVRYELLYRFNPASSFRVLGSHDLAEPVLRPLGVSPDGQGVYVEWEDGDGRIGLYRLDPISGALGQPLASQPAAAITGLRHDPVSGRLALVEFATQRSWRALLESSWSIPVASLSDRFPDHGLALVGHDSSRNALWRATAPHLAPSYTWLNSDGRLRPVSPQGSAGVPAQSFSFSARDGLEISGYLTTRARGPLPTVVRVHGGPWARDQWRYDPEVQFLARLGYAVLQVNFRGSRGLGHDLLMAGRGQWGRAMQDDLVDAIHWASASGLVDPGRVCIMGASYGGYAALMGVLRDPEVFRCAVAHAPVTDLVAQINGYRQAGHQRAYLEWRWMVGDPRSETDSLAAVSPMNLARGLTRPVLVSVGDHDKAVEPAQVRAFVERADHELVRLIQYSNEGHAVLQGEHRRHYYEELAAFLDAHLATPPRQEQSP